MNAACISLEIVPGKTAFTRMPCGAHSSASARTSPWIAALAAPSAARPANSCSAAIGRASRRCPRGASDGRSRARRGSGREAGRRARGPGNPSA